MIFEKIEDITVNFEKDGKLLVKELKKEVLSRGVWTTIIFLYQELDKKIDEFKEPKISIRRYKRTKGYYQIQTKISFSSESQAKQVASTINKWIALYGIE